MGYRDDRDALRERIELLEKKAAGAVSPEELAGLREELVEAKGRLDGEREALEGLLGRLDGKAPTPKRPRWRFVAAGVLVSLTIAAAAATVLLIRAAPSREPDYEGAPNAPRASPPRREIDREVARLLPDLDGCLPEGRDAEIQVEITFRGRDGAIGELVSRNVSEHDSYPMSTVDCLRSVLHGVGAAPFRNPSYRYHLTLHWSEGRLQRPPIWDRYGLVEDAP